MSAAELRAFLNQPVAVPDGNVARWVRMGFPTLGAALSAYANHGLVS